MTFRCIIAFLFFFKLNFAQDLSGLWVHDVDGTIPSNFSAIYAIMYIQVDDAGNISGYTYDYQAGGTCRFHLDGSYNYEKQQLIAANTKKISKSFLHARSRFNLFYEVIDEEEYLVGRARQKGVHGLLFSFGGLLNIPLRFRKVKENDYEETKGYNELKPYIDTMETHTSPSLNTEVLKEGSKTQNSIEEEVVGNEMITADNNEEEITAFTRDKDNRESELISSHKVSSRKVTFEIYDNSRQDGDRISIYVNDSLIEYNIEVIKRQK